MFKRTPKSACATDVYWKAKGEKECRKEKCNSPMWLEEGTCIDIDIDKGCGCFPNIIDKEAYKSGEMNESPGIFDRTVRFLLHPSHGSLPPHNFFSSDLIHALNQPHLQGDPGFGEEEILGFRPEIDSEKSFYAIQVKSTNQQKYGIKPFTNYIDFHTTDDKARGEPDEAAARKSCTNANMGYIGTIFDHARIPAVFSGTPNFLVDVIAATGNRKKTGDASDYRMAIDDRQAGKWQSTKVQAQANRLYEDRERGCCRVEGDTTWRKPSTTETTEKCADENGWCECNGGKVSYGANGFWTDPVEVWGAVECSNTVFGDPIVGTVKSCTCTKPPEVLEVSLDKPMKEKECARRCAAYMYGSQEDKRRCVGIETSKKNGGTCELHFTPIVFAENDQRTTCAKANCYRRTDYEFEFLKMRNKCPKYYDYSYGKMVKRPYIR